MVKEALGALKTVLGVGKEALFGEVSVHDPDRRLIDPPVIHRFTDSLHYSG